MLFGKHINKYYFKYIIGFILGIIALIVVDIYQLQIPEIIGDIIDALKEKTLTKEALKDYMLEMLMIAVIMFSGRFMWRITLLGNATKIETDLRREMFIKTEKMSQEYLGKNKTGALMALYLNDLETIKRTFGNGTVMFIDAFFLGALAFIKMWKLDPVLTIISSIPMLLLALCGGIIGKNLKRKSENNHKAFEELSDFAQESFSGISVVKAFVKEAKELKAFAKRNKKNADTTIAMVKASTRFSILLNGVINSIVLIIIGYGSYLVYAYVSGNSADVFTVGDLTKFTSFFGTLTWPMMAIGQLINMTSQGKASVKRIGELLDAEVEINDDKAIPLEKPIEGKITFKDFNFRYPSSEKDNLKHIDLTIEQGQMIGIIGRTGSGKTTLVNSLLRLYNVEEGKVFIDDVDIMTIPLKDVRDAISYVPQDNFLYSTSILENISFYTDEIDKEKVSEVAKMADVEKDILDFNHQYDTILGERGVTVSGGQRQRISIARALIKDAPILILDDSVSAVDTKTEEIILNNLRRIRKGKTTIIIAHRISTLETLDKIIVLERGKVIGYAPHNVLVKENSFYQRQVKLQELEAEAGGTNE